jgi:hypothetical protein
MTSELEDALPGKGVFGGAELLESSPSTSR